MQRKTFRNLQCPIARSLERVGEWWSILILRDAFYGTKRFDEFQRNLDIAPNMLTRRLNGLVQEGLLEKRQYSERPPRYEYVLTECGRDFRPVLLALLAWGNRNFAPEGPSVQIVDRETGEVVEPLLVDAHSREPLQMGKRHVMRAGPAADENTRARLSSATSHMTNPKPTTQTA
ncbi:winged helix-turn-helix transcriptional regulator [Cupriavidus pauculus]|jgi:DNA-binding HxlR family transcriptional regulator|uniref:winged helix-turn-helix transcriptional regulator n=1 Tax=Cupriavidus pauculus TaxID=82633 RepID=UPI003857585E